ncbi:Smg-4/UPF3 family-domain-containing protein [Scleroderma yunnanense]
MAGAEARQGSRKQQKQREQKSQTPANHSNNGNDRLKTVVRRLPPNLPEEVFWQSVQTWVTDETVSWKMYEPGKTRKRSVMNKESVSSRAYIAFRNEEMLATFSREYDGHIFKDKAGNESQAIVEFAPFQKVPTERKKVDARNNTIEKDEEYISFLESLKGSEKTEPITLEALIAAAQPAPQPTTTPLLEALKAEKSAQRDKEAILRNHAHYKESAIIAKKEEARKKASIAAQAQAAAIAAQKQPSDAGPTSQSTSRKAKKAAVAAQKAAAQDTQPPVRAAPKHPVSSSGAGSGGGSIPPPVPQPSITPTSPTAPRVQRERMHKGPKTSSVSAIARANPAESTIVASPAPAPAPSTERSTTATATAAAPPPHAPAAPQARRGRPVIGIGRQFEAALSGAVGGGSSGSERKRRGEKEKEKDESATASALTPAGASEGKSTGRAPGKRKDHHTPGGKHKEDNKSATGVGGVQPSAPVPNILQRSDVPTGTPGEVLIMQRPQSPREAHGGHHHPDAPPVRGGGRRGRGRGRGGHRGG